MLESYAKEKIYLITTRCIFPITLCYALKSDYPRSSTEEGGPGLLHHKMIDSLLTAVCVEQLLWIV